VTDESFRKDERVAVSLDCLVHRNHENFPCHILDLGLGGLSAELDRKLEASQILELEFSLPGSELSLRLPARVQWCRRRDERWHVGMAFVDPPGRSLVHIAEWLARTPRTTEHP